MSDPTDNTLRNRLMTLTKLFFSRIVSVMLISEVACGQTLKNIVLNDKDFFSGHYLVVEPETDSIAGVLVLLSGFGQRPDVTPPETKLHNVAYANHILTVFF